MPLKFENIDIFENTSFADNRSKNQKSFENLQQEVDQYIKYNQFDITGLPLFSKDEREARNTQQLNLFKG